MNPLVISTYPENGSKDMALNSLIVIGFAGPLDAAKAEDSKCVELRNLNDNTIIPTALSYTADVSKNKYEIAITPADNQYGNMLLGSTSYRLVLSNLLSEELEPMTGNFSLDFTTVSDSIVDVIPPPIDESVSFDIINFFPRKGSFNISPSAIKIMFSKPVNETTITDAFIVTTDPLEDIRDIGFMDISTVTGSVSLDVSVEYPNQIVTFTPQAPLEDNKKYTVLIKGIYSMDSDVMATTMYSFYSKFSPVYTSVQSVLSESLTAITASMDPVDLLRMIKENSDLAKFIAEQAGNTDNVDWVTPAKFVVEYVRAKTRYDIVLDRILQISSDPTAKTLADLTVEYSRNIQDLLTMADKLKLAYEYWENMLRGSKSGKVTPKPFRKGENVDEDPDFMNRKFKDIDGNKSW